MTPSPEPRRCAVIDLGTNTFHLLVVEMMPDGGERELHRERVYVRLASGGIGAIGEAPFLRAMAALRKFKSVLEAYRVERLKAFGTAALRTASNGGELVHQAWSRFGIRIEVISGDEEAHLIHRGVLRAIPPLEDRMVIMDIGGGSVEFIIADNEKVHWVRSFPVGVAVLFHDYHHSDPVSEEELDNLRRHLDGILRPFFDAIQQYEARVLVGASGTFDVMEALMDKQALNARSSELAISHFLPLYNRLIRTSLSERLGMEGIPERRAEMIVVALELIHFVLGNTSVNRIIVSAFAMKEGVLSEMKD